MPDAGTVRPESWRDLQGDRRRSQADTVNLHGMDTVKLIQRNVTEPRLTLLPILEPLARLGMLAEELQLFK